MSSPIISQDQYEARMNEAIPAFSKQALLHKLGELYPQLNQAQLGQLVNRVLRWRNGAQPDRLADLKPYEFGHSTEHVLANIAQAQQDIGVAVSGLGIDVLEDNAVDMIQWTNHGYIRP